MLLPGDPAPDFRVASSVNPNFHFDTVAGRYLVLYFFGSSQLAASAATLEAVRELAERFALADAAFFAVSVDPQDRSRLAGDPARIVYFWDDDLSISKKYDALVPVTSEASEPGADDDDASVLAGTDAEDSAGGDTPSVGKEQKLAYLPRIVLLDQAMRVAATIPLQGEDPTACVARLAELLDALPNLADVATPAPVLIVPHVFEPELCRTLIEYYKSNGGEDSGFMRDVGGKTVAIVDYGHKRRSDCDIKDEQLVRATQERLSRRVVPAIRQAYQFNVTRIERHIVACYDAADGGHFRAHRDNTTLGTAHRRFAVTINLNAEEFEGGELWFPEFSRRRYKATTGGAVVFSCSLLHEATPVTKGTRFAFLPFLYDDAAARIRERNRQFVAGGAPIVGASNAQG